MQERRKISVSGMNSHKYLNRTHDQVTWRQERYFQPNQADVVGICVDDNEIVSTSPDLSIFHKARSSNQQSLGCEM